MVLTVDDLFASPNHYLHSFVDETALFMPMDRASYQRSIFLDSRVSPAVDASMPIAVSSLLPRCPPPRPISWIFHVAHCGSTLLARVLDDTDSNLVLREPLALRQVAIARDETRLPLALAMISKRYRTDAPTIVKANVPVNFILPQIAAAHLEARAILLYLPWRDYLPAILRSDNHRAWLRRVAAQLTAALGDVSGLSDAEIAAALWAAQIEAFARATQAMPNARSLDAENFFADPRSTLVAAAMHLEVPMTAEEVKQRVAGPLFTTYSKNPSERFDNSARVLRKRGLEQSLANDLIRAEHWLERYAPTASEAYHTLKQAALLPSVA